MGLRIHYITLKVAKNEKKASKSSVKFDNLFVRQLVRQNIDNGLYLFPETHSLNLKPVGGMETYWDRLKNVFAVGSFSGYSDTVIWQDLYATIIATNLQSILCADCQGKLNLINRNRHWNYRINRNISAGLIKDCFVKLFFTYRS